jgi:serine/threonine protein kinase
MGLCFSFLGGRLAVSNQVTTNGENNSVEQLIPQREQMGPVQSLEELEKEIRIELRKLIVQSSDRENSSIILPQDLAQFWSQIYYMRFYTQQQWYDRAWDRTNIMLEYQRIISILILGAFCKPTDWARFRKIFIDKGRKDVKLPFAIEDLEREDFLGPDYARLFFEKQWIVCPLVIEERREPYELLGKEAERRFPYIEKGEKIGEGATGTVYKQVIAARHLKYSSNWRESENTMKKPVACKRVVEQSVMNVEFKNLEDLRKCLSEHRRIMVNIATIVRTEENVGRVHLILYDLAAYDLYTLLTLRPLSSDQRTVDNAKDHLIRHDSGPQRRNDSHISCEQDYIKEIKHLADALDFLHNRLYRETGLYLVHNDLKPENILVFYPDSQNEDEKYPVGQWKIADFGLAKFKQLKVANPSPAKKATTYSSRVSVSGLNTLQVHVEGDSTHRRNSLASVKSPSLTPAKRDPGMYTPPEVEGKGMTQQDPRAGDLWAFGCILTEVLAYAVRPGLISEIRKECDNGLDQRFHDERTKMVKEPLLAWLHNLPSRCLHTQTNQPVQWVVDCVKLIEQILAAEPKNRPRADRIRSLLEDIESKMERGETFRFVDDVLSQSSTPPSSMSNHTYNSESPKNLSPRTANRPRVIIGEIHAPNYPKE